jgi:thioredoxin 1
MGVIEVNAGDWEKNVLKSTTLVLVDFWHERCPWCKRLELIYDEVAEEYGDKVKFAKINVLSSHENQHLASENGGMGTPTLIFYCEGRSVGTTVGFQPKERLKQLVDDMLDKYKKCLDQSTKMNLD